MPLPINLNTLTVIRAVVKLVLVFLSFYFNYSLRDVGIVVLVLLLSEVYEISAQYFSSKHEEWYSVLYGTIGGMNGFLTIWMLDYTSNLGGDLYLIVFVMVVLMAAVGGLVSSVVTALTASIFYVLFSSSDVEMFALVLRTLMFVVTGIIAGVLAELAQQNYRGLLRYKEMATFSKSAKNLKEEFLLIAHHNLRTPLAQMKGYHEALLETDLGDIEKRNLSKHMGESIDKIESLIEHILAVITLESHKQKTNFEEADMLGLILRQVNHFRSKADLKEIRLNADLPESPIKILIDTKRMEMIVGKILENAVQYTPQGGAIKVVLREFETILTLDVSDTGPGIDSQDVTQIFEQGFHRANAMTPSSEGVGMGLYLAKLVVEQHGGTIDIKSDGRAGTTVTITLPKLTSQNFFENLL